MLWLNPPRPDVPPVENRRLVIVEVVIVFTITLGLSGAYSLLSLLDSLLKEKALADQKVALNVSEATNQILDFLGQLLNATRLLAFGALGLYLLWRAGMRLRHIGLDVRRIGGDLGRAAGLAALIGVPGLAFYLVARAVGANLTVVPTTLDHWWSYLTLTISAFANAWAEEVLVVGYLITRLRQLGMAENKSLLISAVLRGSYHLYQGFGGFLGNVVMGLVFGRFWQRTNRLWPLVLAHFLIDFVAFVGYAILRGHVAWLP
ncbi:CPBP family intramembrane glutamic endopeptidase [Actinophytocola oryzae]|uniref:CAAX prenyl protease-like protein n=1 Tax=Actinophytocola oryzae TaxID=502181 RepID=A0A4R7VN43_9PSEU|nr:CPBP family intramembrane glutamic endopeptidase [Actinophytocola oryzae]TDV50942.1 CAAX prenyl protease-like protein [Actinophytocola oryzae]